MSGNEPTTYNILFVCTGNTCRSPLAEAIAQRQLHDRGWTHVSVRSAGAAALAGGAASEQAAAVGSAHGLELGGHRTRPLTDDLIAWADLVLVMSDSHLHAVADMGGGEKAALITDFLAGDNLGAAVEDPFGAGDDAYERTFQQLDEAIQAALERLEPMLSP